MTENPDVRRPRWQRLLSSTRRRVEIVALSLVLILCGAVTFAVVPALASAEKLTGRPVPAGDVPTVVTAALSCPSLNPPRLAAQLMAASGFSDGGPYGNVAGMDNATWDKWRPNSAARVGDRAAVITAFAHRTCAQVGQLRAEGLTGDLWPAAVAAGKVGVEAVVKARGIPPTEKKYVDTVAAYARWYADQPSFSVDSPTTDPSADMRAIPVPDGLVPVVRLAGKVCPAITPARIAAQLRTVSGFNANLRSADGAAGIAQFRPDLWETYRNRQSASVWNPQDAIMSMGVAMCAMDHELSGLGTDPYVLALGAYQWGMAAVRQANGLPRTTVPQLADQVIRHAAEYDKDGRLTVPTEPGRKPPVSPTPSVVPTSPSGPQPSRTTGSPGHQKPPTGKQPLYRDRAYYRLENVWAKSSVVEAPGLDEHPPVGTAVRMWLYVNSVNQKWQLLRVDDTYAYIINAHTQMALAVGNASSDDDAKLVLEPAFPGDENQQWELRDAGGGAVFISNRRTGKVMNLIGQDSGAPGADGTWNEASVVQAGFDASSDQRWVLHPM